MNSDGWEIDRLLKSKLQEENTKIKINYDKLDELNKALVQQILGLETENKKVWERYREEHEQICRAIGYIEEHKLNRNKVSEMLMGDEIVKLLDILRGEK